MSQSFGEWLNAQIAERGWSQSEFARRARISNQMVSVVISGQAPAGTRTAKGIARALDLPVDEVMQKAGIIPDGGALIPAVREINRRLLTLDEPHRKAALKALDETLKAIEAVAKLSLTLAL